MATDKTDVISFRMPTSDHRLLRAFSMADDLSVSEWLLPIVLHAMYADKQRRLQIKVEVRRVKVMPHLYRYGTTKRLTDADVAALVPNGQVCVLALIPVTPTVRVPAKTIKRKRKEEQSECPKL